MPFGYLDRHEKVTDRQKLVPYPYPRQNSSKRGTNWLKLAKCCRELATLYLSHYELINQYIVADNDFVAIHKGASGVYADIVTYADVTAIIAYKRMSY